MFHLTGPGEFTGSLATFTVNAGEIVDIGALWFERPSATSDQGSAIVIPGDASTMADLVKEAHDHPPHTVTPATGPGPR